MASKKRLYSILAALSIYGGFSGFGSNSSYPKTETEKLIDETKSIKGMSAKEMGTSGKKKSSRARRKNNNKRKRSC